MARILFLVDYEEGHVLATMSLSKTLAARGHAVRYAGLPDAEETVVGQGFSFHPLMQDAFPKGAMRSSRRPEAAAQGVCFARCVSGELLDDVIRDFKPDVTVALSLYYLEALAVHFRYDMPVALFTPDLRPLDREERASSIIDSLMSKTFGVSEFIDMLRNAGIPVRSLADIVAPLLEMPELIALPRSFEVSEIPEDALVYYIGCGVDPRRSEPSRSWRTFAGARPLIYCSLGSQCGFHADVSATFFNAMLRTLAARPEWRLVLSVGKTINIDSLSPRPSNVYAANWVPQMDLLSVASLMINHGGIGSVKECILSRVPMVVFPLMRDQFDCAERVTRLGLGLSNPIESATPDLLADMIARALDDGDIRRNINAMSEAFRNEDRISVGADVIEDCARRAVLRPARTSA